MTSIYALSAFLRVQSSHHFVSHPSKICASSASAVAGESEKCGASEEVRTRLSLPIPPRLLE